MKKFNLAIFFLLLLASNASLSATLTLGAEEFHPWWGSNISKNCQGWGQYCYAKGSGGYLAATIRLPQRNHIQISQVSCQYRDNHATQDMKFYIRANQGNGAGFSPGHANRSSSSNGASTAVRSVNLMSGSYSLREDTSYKIFVYFPEASSNLRIYNCTMEVADLIHDSY